MKKIIIVLIIVCLFISGCKISQERNLVSSNVEQVLDGDTIVLNDSMHVRLLNINAPELGEQCSQEAKSRLEQLILNKTVWLERDSENSDKYNRELRYIFLSENKNPKNFDDLVNLILLKEGLAKLLIMEPNTKYEEIFRNVFDEVSKNNNSCLFKSQSQYSDCFTIQIHADAQGDDCSNANDEYIILKNICSDIEMNGWIIRDSARHEFIFNNFTAKTNQEFILHSGSGTNTEIDLFWNSKLSCPAIWNNDHDTFFLYDDKENLVFEESY